MRHNATKDYTGHESSCPLHWHFAATLEDHFKADMVKIRG